jgi:hypothetical protein
MKIKLELATENEHDEARLEAFYRMDDILGIFRILLYSSDAAVRDAVETQLGRFNLKELVSRSS